MKKVFVFVFSLVLLVLAGTTVFADSGPGWSDPVEIVRNEGDEYLENPKLFSDNALWVMYEQYPSFGIGRTADGTTWETSPQRGPMFGGFYSSPKPVAVTPHDVGEEALHFEFIRTTAEKTQIFRKGLRVYTPEGFGGGGDTWITEMDPYYAHWRYNAVDYENDHHIVWRNFYNGAVQYIRLEDHGLDRTDPVTITSEFQEGGAPALWVGSERVVVVADDTTDGFQYYQSWAYISEDGGQTWSDKMYIGEGAHPRIAQLEENLVVLLQSGSSNRIMSFVSRDLGDYWEGPNYLATGDFPNLESLTASAEVAVAAWSENDNIYAAFSYDGRSWEEDLVFSSDVHSRRPDVAIWDDQIHVVWKEAANGSEPERILISSRDLPRYKLFMPLVAKNW